MQPPLQIISKTFGKEEKLKLKKDIETLFRTGKAFSILPIRVIYTIKLISAPTPQPIQIGVSVPKKRFKHAVKRNRVKRLIRETWRLEKHKLLPYLSTNQQIQLFFVYQSNQLPTFNQLTTVMSSVCSKLEYIINEKQASTDDQTIVTLDH